MVIQPGVNIKHTSTTRIFWKLWIDCITINLNINDKIFTNLLFRFRNINDIKSVPTVDPCIYQTPLMGAVGTRNCMSSTLSWVLWWFGWYTSAGMPVVWVERDFSGTCHTISIFHIFYHLRSKYYHLPTFTHHVYLRVGDIEREWLTRSVISNTLIHFDFCTFLADTRATIHIGAILLTSILYCYMWIFVLRSLYGALVHLHTFTHYFSHLFWSVAGASWLIGLLCMDTMETTLSDQFLFCIK